MEIIKSIINLLLSFFQHKHQVAKNESDLAAKTEEAVVEKIRASENAAAVQQRQRTDEALVKLDQKHKEERDEAKADPKADDNQFGSTW